MRFETLERKVQRATGIFYVLRGWRIQAGLYCVRSLQLALKIACVISGSPSPLRPICFHIKLKPRQFQIAFIQYWLSALGRWWRVRRTSVRRSMVREKDSCSLHCHQSLSALPSRGVSHIPAKVRRDHGEQVSEATKRRRSVSFCVRQGKLEQRIR